MQCVQHHSCENERDPASVLGSTPAWHLHFELQKVRDSVVRQSPENSSTENDQDDHKATLVHQRIPDRCFQWISKDDHLRWFTHDFKTLIRSLEKRKKELTVPMTAKTTNTLLMLLNSSFLLALLMICCRSCRQRFRRQRRR